MHLTVTRYFFFFSNDPATTEIYTLSLHDALPISTRAPQSRWWNIPTSSARCAASFMTRCAKSSRTMRARRSEEHTSELQSRQYLVCRLLLEKKNKPKSNRDNVQLLIRRFYLESAH